MQHAYRGDDETAEAEILGRMTAEEYFARALEAPRDARKAELIDGALILFPSPLDIHERLHGFLFRLRLEWLWPESRFIPVRDAIDSMLS